MHQILGWRGFIWGVYHRWMPDDGRLNTLGARVDVRPAFTGEASTDVACVTDVTTSVHDHTYAHHIQRLMVIANLATTAGAHPARLTDWMHASFIDGYEG